MGKIYNDLKSLIKTGFFHIFGSSVINKVLGFLSNVILVRLLTKSEYGRFTYAWNIYSMAIILNGLGADSAIIQLCSERSGDESYARKVMNFGAGYGFFSSAILGMVLLFISFFIPLKIANSSKLLCLLFALPFFQFLYNLLLVYFRSQKRNVDYSNLSIINTATHLIFSAVSAILFRERGLILGAYVSFILSCFIGIRVMRVHLFSREGELDKSEKKAMLSISIVSVCNNGLSQMMYLLDVFVLGIVAAQETILATYRVGMTIPAALTFIPASLVVYIYPYFAEHRNNPQWCMRLYKKLVLLFGLFNLTVSVFLVALAPFIVKLLYGSQYLDAVSIFRILSVNYFISATFRTVAGNLLVTQRKLKFNLFVGIVSGLINIIADYFFIQWWGSIGAALATVLVTIVSGGLYTSYYIFVLRKAQSKAC